MRILTILPNTLMPQKYMRTRFTYKQSMFDPETGKTAQDEDVVGFCYIEERIENNESSDGANNKGNTLLMTNYDLRPRPEVGSKILSKGIEYTVEKVFPVPNPELNVINHFEITLTGGNY